MADRVDWQTRAQRAEADLREQRGREITARVLARRLWQALAARTGLEVDALFSDPDVLRIADAAFDAADTLWERHKVTIVPCRRILEGSDTGVSFHAGPSQPEMYLGQWPDGTTRNLTRAELLMMGGQDPEDA